jgi:hypothetical protein
MYTRGGLGQSNINATTIWTPATGYLPTTGSLVGAVQAPSYVAPVQTAAPACSSGPADTADSPACIAALLANQQGNMNAANAANYNYDLETCESNYAENVAPDAADGITPGANTCSTNTFGLTPTVSGGYSGSGVLGSTTEPAIVPAPVVVPVVPPAGGGSGSGSGTGTGSGSGTGNGGGGAAATTTDPNGIVCATSALVAGYCPTGTSFFTQDESILGQQVPVWGLIAAGVAALVFLPMLMGGRR